jgi:non-specific serine/threonine protein kinase
MESSRQPRRAVSGRLTTDEPRHNLPELLTALVGRERAVAEVVQRLETTRLLTLVGAGGIGKTRLALCVGAELVPRYPAGVWLVELASLTDPAMIPRAIAASLGIYEEPDRDLTATIADAVRSRPPLLVILDNCEHLIADVAIIAERLLRACPGLSILATSREALGITGETDWRVPSLSLPGDTESVGTDADALAVLTEHGATRLFLERARAVQTGFAVTEQNAPAIVQICRRLDGIELAAARARVLTPQQIADRLDDRFRLLTDSSRTADPRQRTLRATIDWSYALLSETERVVLQRLSVFAGGCTLEAIEAICHDDAGSGIGDVLDLVTHLADRSLVVADLSGAEARYRLLETIRAYALERLEASGEAERIRQRHAEYFLALAEEAGPAVRLISGRHWLDRLDTERDNVRAALAWSAEASGDPNLMPRIAGTLWWYWYLRGHFTEGRQWLERALDIVADPAVRLTVLIGASVLAFSQDDYARARVHALGTASLGRACSDRRAVAWALTMLGHGASRLGDVDRALAYCDEGLTLSRQVGDAEAIAHALYVYGNATERTGSYDRAEALYAECERWARLGDHVWFLPLALHRLANIAALRDDLDRATALCTEALALIRQTGNSWSELPALEVVIRVAQRRDDVDRVQATAHQVGQRYRDLGYPGGIGLAASPLAWAAHRRGDEARAARLLGAADALMAVSGRVRLPGDQADHDANIALVRASLGEADFAAAWAEGRAMTLEQAVEYTLQQAESEAAPPARQPESSADTSPRDIPPLTPRETEVARLLARGCSNRQIADTLVISERTADSHVYRLLGKLGFSSRAQVAVWAVRHGLGDELSVG